VIGQTAMQVFTLSNIGGTMQPAIAFTFTGATSELSLTQDTCSGVQLPPAGTCTVAVVFAPASVGDKLSELSNMSTVNVGLDGSGIAAASDLAMSPTSKTFGNWDTGTTSSYANTFTVTNNGATTTAPLVTKLLGTDASQFSISSDTCNGTALAPAATCTVGVVFSPTTMGAKSVTVQATGGAGATAQSFTSGTGV